MQLQHQGNTGVISGSNAVAFFRRSALPDMTLRIIWEISDARGQGFLSRGEFFFALRLVALAQSSQPVSLQSFIATAHLRIPPPRIEPLVSTPR